MTEEEYVDQMEDEVCMHDENIEGKEQNFESQAEQRSMVIEVDSPEQEFRANEERIGPQQQEKKVSGDDCSILSTIPLTHRQKLITKQGHEQGSRKGRLQKRSIRPKHTPKPPREISGPCKKNLQMEETGKNVEILEDAEVGALRGEDKRTTEEENSLIEVCLINDDNMVPEWLTYDLPLAVNTNMREGGIEEYVGEMEPHKEDMLDELIEEVYMELTEAPDIQSLTTEDEEAEGNLQREEHYQVQGNQDSVNVECQAEPSDMAIEIDPQEQEYEDNDDLNEQHLQESESSIPDEAEMNVEPKNVEFDESCWTEGQNHTQIHVQEDIGGMEGQIQVNDDKDEGVEGQKFVTGIEDEINKRSLMDRSGEMSNCDPKEREYNIVEKNECRGNPIVEVMIEQQLHPLPLPTILALELDEPRKEVSHWNEQQDQPTKGQTEIIGQEKMSEGDCPLIEEENNLKNALEVLEEQNQKIEVIIEQNQREDQHCNFVDRDKKENEEFEHCDDMRKSEKGNSDEPNPSEKAQAGTLEQKEHHHKEPKEDQNQHLEQIKSLFSQEVEIAEHVPPIKESKEVSTEIVNLGDNAENDQNTILTSERSSVSMMQNEQTISENMEQQSKCTDQQSDNSGVEMTSEVKSMEDSSTSQSHQNVKQKMEKPQCRQLRPRPTKSQPDQIEESSLDNSSETDQRRKLRPRRSKDESSKAANSDEPLATRLRKRKEVGARRSLRH
ncbi:hypothetical protein BUALT_Bualt17G0108900 [Buddleja alternifolia]|uniref:Uncharacterized protein n=1 Tax=Buddleja alternifolia TaxID=168488 RepID=A0AAV6WGX8_9LAMI|nr:hypothetical protein BUALT_Bualt17G0108900 [Buddleja alternifolia]